VAARNGVSPPQRRLAAGTQKSDAFGKCTPSSLPPNPNQEQAARDSASDGRTLAATAMLSVYDGQRCIGFIIARGKTGVEAFDVNDRSLGIFASMKAAFVAVSEAVS
jgi:hypothetical protein